MKMKLNLALLHDCIVLLIYFIIIAFNILEKHVI
jgi:hypothetical protein